MIRVVSVVLALVWGEAVYAQAPAAPVVQPRVYANMLQLMRGTLYPQSNVIFTAQVEDPAAFKPAAVQQRQAGAGAERRLEDVGRRAARGRGRRLQGRTGEE